MSTEEKMTYFNEMCVASTLVYSENQKWLVVMKKEIFNIQ